MRAIALVAGLLAVGGCVDPGGSDLAIIHFDGPIPSVGWVEVDAPAGAAWVDFGLTAAFGRRVEVRDGTAALIGLKPDRDYYWRVTVERPDGTVLHSGIQEVRTPPLPDDLPPFELEHVDPDRSELADGWILTSVYDPRASYAVILDGDGDVVWWVGDPGPEWKINRVRPSLDGESVLIARNHRQKLQDIGTIERIGLDGAPMGTTRALLQHHDFVEHDDGTFAWLSWAFTEESLVPFDAVPTAYDRVRVVEEGATEGAASRVAFDALASLPARFAPSCAHSAPDVFVPGHRDWSHGNSIVWSPEEDRWYGYFRYHDALVAIDRSSGAYLWALGGDYGEFTAEDPDDLPSHAHLSEVWPGGFLAFDNQNHATERSRVAEYAWDEDARTVRLVWSREDPEGRFSGYLGDARRLPGGNRLVSWSPYGRLTEITPEGDVVWAVDHPHDVSRITPLWHLAGPQAP